MQNLRIDITQKIQKEFQKFKLTTSVSSEKELKSWESFLSDTKHWLNCASIQSAYLLFSPKKSFNESHEFISKLEKNIKKAESYINTGCEEEQRIRAIHGSYTGLDAKFKLILKILESDEIPKTLNVAELMNGDTEDVGVDNCHDAHSEIVTDRTTDERI